MQGATKTARVREAARVLVVSQDTEFSACMVQRLKRSVRPAAFQCAAGLERLREMIREGRPEIIVLDDRVVGGSALSGSLAEFTAVAPVILVAPYERAAEAAQLIAAGQIDFVPYANQWAWLAASLAERKLRDGVTSLPPLPVLGRFREQLAEMFRHEINNPLTGILGNAELLLAHNEQRPDAETQRIRTIVELAVRLREAVRRLGETWGERPASK